VRNSNNFNAKINKNFQPNEIELASNIRELKTNATKESVKFNEQEERGSN